MAKGWTWHVTLASYVVTISAWGALCAPWLLGTVTIPYDAKAHFHAQLQFLANALHNGQSPFWTPNVFGGSPQIADPQSLIFSPAFLIAAFDPTPSIGTIDAYVLVLLGGASLAILAMFQDRGWHPVGGVVAAIAFAFGASAAWRVQHIGQVQSFAFFAVSLWLLGRALDRGSLAWGAAAGLSAGIMLAEPDQIALLACYILAGLVIVQIGGAERPLSDLRRLLPTLSMATVVGAAVVAVPLGMVFLFVEDSSRPEIAFTAAARGSLHPASLLTAVVGDLFGALDPKVEYWGPYSVAWNPNDLALSQNMSQIYTGALPILLLLTIGIVRGQAFVREIRYFTIALVTMTLYALGWFTPLFHILYEILPGVRFFRRPADATFMLGGLLAIVGGYLVHRVANGLVPAAGVRGRWAERGIVLSVFAAASVLAIKQGHAFEAIRPLLVAATTIATATCVVGQLRPALARGGVSAVVLVGAAMATDLGYNNGPNESTALPAANYDILKQNCQNETVRLIKSKLAEKPGSARRDRVEMVGLGFSWPNLGMIHGFDHVLGYNPLRLEVVTDGIGADDTIAGWQQRRFTPLFPSYRSMLADMLGLAYIATPIPIEAIDTTVRPGDFRLIARTKEAYVYVSDRALPRTMLVADWQVADFDALLRTGIWPAFDPQKTVLLETAPPEVTTGPLASSSQGNDQLPISITRYENTVVEIDVSAAHAGLVVLNDVWHPWWRATIDGQPTPILKANVMFRAVQVAAGRHHIRFEFVPLIGAIQEFKQPTVQKVLAGRNKLRRPRAG